MKRIIKIAASLFFLGIYSIAFAEPVPGVTDTEVKIGEVLCASGTFAQLASYGPAGEAYYKLINSKGGIHGRKINLIMIDTQCNNAKASEAARDLVERQNVFAMVGSQGAQNIAFYKYLIEKKVPHIFFGDGLKAYTTPANPYLFPSRYTWDIEGRTAANYVLQNFPGKKVCIAQFTSPLGEEYTSGVLESFKNSKNKNPLGSTAKFDRAAIQGDSDVLKFKQEKCEVIINSTNGTIAESMINYGVTQGYTPIWFVHSFAVSKKFIDLVNDKAKENVYSATSVVLDEDLGEGWKDFSKIMQENKVAVTGTSAVGFLSAEVFVEILKRAGQKLTRESLITAAESLKHYKCSMCIDEINESHESHVPFRNATIIRIKNNKWVKVN